MFEGWPLERAVAAAGDSLGVSLDRTAVERLVEHARAVEAANGRLHLTSIRDPALFVRRHIYESLAGVSLLAPVPRGAALDLGSGNGYPGLPLAIACPSLHFVLAEASPRKADFLRRVVEGLALPGTIVAEINVQRGADLAPFDPFSVLTARAVGGWERLVPKLVARLAPGGRIVLWAGADIGPVTRRASWRRLRHVASRSIEGMDRVALQAFEIGTAS